MKKTLLLFFAVLMMPCAVYAQVRDGIYTMDSTTVTFANDSISNFIPDTAATPLWQIGHSRKSFFGIDSSGTTTIMTDTLNPYPVNANNWFVIKVPNEFNVIIDFWHKYQTDSGHAGGIVEFSLDTGTTWQNIKGPCNVDSSFSGFTGVLTTNFYASIDTLATGEPAFMGSSDSLQYSRFQFFEGFPERIKTGSGSGCNLGSVDTFYVRFRFVSDSTVDSLAGWEIDSIKIQVDYWGGGIAKINKPTLLNTYPNPSYDGLFTFQAIDDEQDYTIAVYNAMGQRVLYMPYSQSLNLSAYAKGLYFYKVTDGVDSYTGQLETE